MQKIIFGIFAHPDDEAFGPCGTLLQEVQNGAELHLVLLTSGNGDLSANPDVAPNLGETRLAEWHESTRLLGAATTHFLGYDDGKLGNDNLIAIADTLETIVQEVLGGRPEGYVEFITFDLNGLTGHIDHIVASRSSCLAFYRLLARGLPMKHIRLYCLDRDNYPTIDTSFVFMEPGHTVDQSIETIDARKLVDKVKTVMYCHRSQRQDCDAQIAKLGDNIALDHFITLS